MLHALASCALNPLLPSTDSSVSVRPACCSRVRSVSMSLPRYHQVEMPMPAPNEPSIVFSCQKQPDSLSTTLVNVADPTALVTSASVTLLHSPLRKPPAVAGGVSVAAGCPGVPQPATATTPASTAARKGIGVVRGMVTGPTTTLPRAVSRRPYTDPSRPYPASAPTNSARRGLPRRWQNIPRRSYRGGPGKLGAARRPCR